MAQLLVARTPPTLNKSAPNKGGESQQLVRTYVLDHN